MRRVMLQTPRPFATIMDRSTRRKRSDKAPQPAVEVIDITIDDLNQQVERLEQRNLRDEDYDLLLKILRAYAYVMTLLRDGRLKLNRLKRLLFGATEKLKNVLPDSKNDAEESPDDGAPSDDGSDENGHSNASSDEASRPKGHGRNGADEYTEAEEEFIEHDQLQAGDSCPECGEGKLYEMSPKVVVRISGQPPIQAKIYRMQRLRCKLCGHLFHATPPVDAQGKKYDETAAAMIGLLKYGTGMPFNRLGGLEGKLGIPLPPSTQWQVVAAYLPTLHLVWQALVRETAGWELFHNDDTSIKILQKSGLQEPLTDSKKSSKERTGTFTSTVVARTEGRDAALFFSSRRHAGENLLEVLRHRSSELEAPLQMCDALSRNMPEELKTIVANCLAHGRRNFVDVVESFPKEVEHVLQSLAVVYRVDAEAKAKKLCPQKRLELHREKSREVMDDLHRWLKRQFDERLVEPNSGLGQAIQYMLNHWEKLTRFLHVAGAPLDNNVAERALKKAILHRKNSLFYRTARGALVGDVYMSLIYTCELNGINPYKYLVALMRHGEDVEARPEAWLPWNYGERLAMVESAGEGAEVEAVSGG